MAIVGKMGEEQQPFLKTAQARLIAVELYKFISKETASCCPGGAAFRASPKDGCFHGTPQAAKL